MKISFCHEGDVISMRRGDEFGHKVVSDRGKSVRARMLKLSL